MKPKIKAKVIFLEDCPVTIHLDIGHINYAVIKLALKKYNNQFGNDVLKALEKAER